MASFGENLRKARLARNMTLQEIATATKIGTRSLKALEDERFDLLPGGIFNKGFVRSYARSVGLDEGKTVAAYMAAAGVSDPETDMQTLSSQVKAARKPAGEPWFALNAATFVGILAVIVGLGLGSLWLKEHRKEAREQAAVQRQMESSTVNAPPATIPAPPAVSDPNASSVVLPNAGSPANASQSPSTTSAGNPAASTASPQPLSAAPAQSKIESAQDKNEPAAPVEVSISATARAWISVRSDGKSIESLTLDPEKPESRTRNYRAQEKLMLTLGNPAGLTVTYNGKPAGVLGIDGRRAVVTFTPQGIEKQ